MRTLDTLAAQLFSFVLFARLHEGRCYSAHKHTHAQRTRTRVGKCVYQLHTLKHTRTNAEKLRSAFAHLQRTLLGCCCAFTIKCSCTVGTPIDHMCAKLVHKTRRTEHVCAGARARKESQDGGNNREHRAAMYACMRAARRE